MSNFEFNSLDTDFRLKDKKRLQLWLERVILSHHKFPSAVQYIFCSDTYLADLNRQYLQHNTYTDIITFNYNSGYHISGDIFISVDRVAENAVTYKTTFEDELHRVMVHGVLHLLGFNDKKTTEARSMRKLENDALEILKSL